MRRVLFFAIIALAVVGCKNSVDDRIEPTLSVEQNMISVNYEAQSVEFTVVSNTAIEVEVKANWAELVDICEGESQIVVVDIAENESQQPRDVAIVVTAEELQTTIIIRQAGRPEMMNLVITHTGTHLDSPLWRGSGVEGSIDWGDGDDEEYSEGVGHDYSGEGPHTATFRMAGAESFRIERVGDIESFEIVRY